MADEDISEQQVQQLLKDAEIRLRSNKTNDLLNSNDLVKNLQYK